MLLADPPVPRADGGRFHARSILTPHPHSVPELRLLTLTDSFSAEWEGLAASHGFTLVRVTEPEALDARRDAVALVSAAGDEGRLEATLRLLPHDLRFVAAVGALADHRVAAAAVRAGAEDYFALPGDLAPLESWLRERAALLQRELDASAFADGERAKLRFDGILGDSPALEAALDRAARVIPRPGVTVLITGETGTGKELLARAIHYNGPRRAAPFVDVNCAAIPEQLLESELFGHEKGAFTGAVGSKPGLMQLADGGTLFLDEIGHLALALQGKILRALEERVIRRVGGTRAIPFDVRLIAATHVDLAGAVRRGEFREDLYYRLNVVPIELPPLRARRDDVILIARVFLERFAREYDLPPLHLTAAAEGALRARRWTGNVRELRNTIERAVLLARGPAIDAADLTEPASGGQPAGVLPFPATIAELNRAAVVRMLELCGGNKTEAARRLGISRPRLHRLLSAAAGGGSEHPDVDQDSDD